MNIKEILKEYLIEATLSESFTKEFKLGKKFVKVEFEDKFIDEVLKTLKKTYKVKEVTIKELKNDIISMHLYHIKEAKNNIPTVIYHLKEIAVLLKTFRKINKGKKKFRRK